MAFGDQPTYTRGSRFDPRDDWRHLLLRTRGRINRSTFGWFFGAAALLWLGLDLGMTYLGPPDPTANTAVRWLLTAPVAWVAGALGAKRLQDLGMSPWVALFLALPYARWLLAAALLATPGESSWNKHGWPPPDAARARFRVH